MAKKKKKKGYSDEQFKKVMQELRDIIGARIKDLRKIGTLLLPMNQLQLKEARLLLGRDFTVDRAEHLIQAVQGKIPWWIAERVEKFIAPHTLESARPEAIKELRSPGRKINIYRKNGSMYVRKLKDLSYKETLQVFDKCKGIRSLPEQEKYVKAKTEKVGDDNMVLLMGEGVELHGDQLVFYCRHKNHPKNARTMKLVVPISVVNTVIKQQEK